MTTVVRRPVPATPRGIRFTETMRGTVPLPADGGTAPVPQPVSIALTVAIPDLAAFRADPMHTATVSGRLYAGTVTGPGGAAIRGGALHLLARTGTGRQRTMAYLLPFTGADGARWLLRGRKDVWHRRGVDVWPATTTLHTTVIRLDGPPSTGGEAVGTLRLGLPDFLRQLRSMRATRTDTWAAALGTGASFFRFFLDRLRRAFVPPGGAAPRPDGRQENP